MGADEEEEAGEEAELNESLFDQTGLFTDELAAIIGSEPRKYPGSLERGQRVQKEARESRAAFTTVTPRDSQEPSSALTRVPYLHSDRQGHIKNKCEMIEKPE